MLINRGKLPKVTIFKHKHVMDSYVSKNETEGILSDISDKINNHIEMIHDNIGFEYCKAPREGITRLSNDNISRNPFIEDIEGLNNRIDESMNIDNLLSYDYFNNKVGMITSNNIDEIDGNTKYTGVKSGKYAKISYNNKEEESNTTFNPYSNYTLTDIVKSFVKDNIVYSIHRGGYITVNNLDNNMSNVIDFTNLMNIYDELIIKNDIYFNKFELCSLVTNASFDNDSLIVITTPNSAFLFNINDKSIVKLNLINNDETIIDIKIINNKIYYISNTSDMEYKIKSFNIIDSTIVEYDILNKDEFFFPNTIVEIGNDILFYESFSKFGKHISEDIKFIQLLENNDNYITTISVQIPISISIITGNDVNSLMIGLVSDDSFLNGSLVNVVTDDNDVFLYEENINILEDNIKSIYHDNSLIVTNTDKIISFIYLNDSKVSFINNIDICKNRNSGNYITDSFILNNNCIITFDDNTYRIVSCDNIPISNVFTTKKKSILSVKNGLNIIYFKNNYLYIINDNNISTLIVKPHDPIFETDEFNNINLFHYINIDENKSYITIITTNVFTRITMISIENITSDPVISILNNSGTSYILNFDINLIRIINNKILIPVIPNGISNIFLIVCDYDRNVIIRNVLTSLSDYSKALYIKDDLTEISIGIDLNVYHTLIDDLFYDVETDTNLIQNIDSNTIINSSNLINTIECDNVLNNYYNLDNITSYNLSSFNNNCLNNNIINKLVKLDNNYLFISNKYIKFYEIIESEFVLKSIYINNLNNNKIININKLSNLYYILNLSNGNIYLNCSEINSNTLSSIIFNNKDIKYCKNNGIIAIVDDINISLIDTINDKYYFDVLNSLKSSVIQFNSYYDKINIDSINTIDDKIYLTISLIDINDNYYMNSFVIKIDISTDFEIEINSLINTELFVIEENTKYIDTNYTDSVIIGTDLYVVYYNNQIINCKIFHSDGSITDISNVYNIPINTTYLGMIAKNDNLYILDCDNVISTSYTEKIPIENEETLITSYCKVLVNEYSFIYLKVDPIEISYYYKGIDNNISTNYNINIEDNLNIYQFIRDNINSIRISYNLNSIFIFKDNTKECIKIDNNGILSLINGYKLFNYTSENIFNSNTFFKYFSDGFIGFNNLSGLYCNYFDKEFCILDNFIVSKNEEIINYNINRYNCIKNNTFTSINEFIKYSEDYYCQKVLNTLNLKSKYINYCFMNNTILFTDSKYLKKDLSGNIFIFHNIPDNDKSYIFKETDNANGLILRKDDNAVFGYEECIFIDIFNSIYNITDIVGPEIKPIFVDDSGTLHSIVKNNNNNVYYLRGVDVENLELISNFNNIVDAVKVQNISNLILMINNIGEVIVFNIDTLEVFNIEYVNDCIIGIPNGYSFIKIISLYDNYTCSIIVRNNVNNKYVIIPGCKISLELDIFSNPVLEINTTFLNILKSYYIDENLSTPFTVPTFSYISGLSLLDSIRTEWNVDYNIFLDIHIGNINIDSDFNTNIDNNVHTLVTNSKNISPRIFIRNNYFIIQYSEKILIYEFIDKYEPNFTPLYEIIQNKFTIKDIMVGGRNIIFTFTDNTCRVISVKKILDESQEQVIFIDDGFYFYEEYKINTNNNDLKCFVTEIGDVGYISNKLAYIYDKIEKTFINVPTTNTNIKYNCIDPLHNRVYCIDENNNFGYIDIFSKTYIPIKVFTEMIIKNIVYTAFNTVEILTNKGIFIYVNENIHKINDIEPVDVNDIIVYPYREYSE